MLQSNREPIADAGCDDNALATQNPALGRAGFSDLELIAFGIQAEQACRHEVRLSGLAGQQHASCKAAVLSGVESREFVVWLGN